MNKHICKVNLPAWCHCLFSQVIGLECFASSFISDQWLLFFVEGVALRIYGGKFSEVVLCINGGIQQMLFRVITFLLFLVHVGVYTGRKSY